MNKINNSADYYPVYKDLVEITDNKSAEVNPELMLHDPDNSDIKKNPGSGSSGSSIMPDAESLVRICRESGLTAFQTHILLLKNAFEGHVYLSYNIRPDQLFENGIYSIKDKEKSLIGNFYEHLDNYWPGLINGWKLILENEKYFRRKDNPEIEERLNDVCFEGLVYDSLANELFRLPVSFCRDFDITRFKVLSRKNTDLIRNWFDLMMISESALGEYLYVRNTNNAYAEEFKDLLRQLSQKNEVLLHYERKLFFAHDANIRTEEELDNHMFNYLTENRLSHSSSLRNKVIEIKNDLPETKKLTSRITGKTKSLFRSISRNCREANDISGSEINPELLRLYLEKEMIYREHASGFPEALLKYMRMLQLLSELMVYRKTHSLVVYEGFQSPPYVDKTELISANDLALIRNNLVASLAYFIINSRTETKINYISDDYLADIHREYLRKQIEFIDKEILRIQDDINNILKSK